MTTSKTTRYSSSWLVTLAALSCAVVTSPAPAATSPTDEGRSEKVSYSAIDLSTPAGAAAVYKRIKVAAHKVCRPQPNQLELRRYGIWNDCYATALSNAVMAVGSPRLTALHDKSTGNTSLTAALTRNAPAR